MRRTFQNEYSRKETGAEGQMQIHGKESLEIEDSNFRQRKKDKRFKGDSQENGNEKDISWMEGTEGVRKHKVTRVYHPFSIRVCA